MHKKYVNKNFLSFIIFKPTNSKAEPQTSETSSTDSLITSSLRIQIFSVRNDLTL